MPLTCRVYELDKFIEADELLEELRGFEEVRVEEVGGRGYEVGYRVLELERREGGVGGVLEDSRILVVEYRGEKLAVPSSSRTRFEFFTYRGRTLLIVLAGGRRARRVARLLSDHLGAEALEARIPPERLRRLQEEGGLVRLVVFDMPRIPGLRRITLAGDAVTDTEPYKEYSSVSDVRYVVFEAEEGMLVGVSTSCAVVAFSRVTVEEFLDFVKDRIVPLTEPVWQWRG